MTKDRLELHLDKQKILHLDSDDKAHYVFRNTHDQVSSNNVCQKEYKKLTEYMANLKDIAIDELKLDQVIEGTIL